MTIDKNDVIIQFKQSPFYQKLDQCIIYLDDIHTRGTDFKFPNKTHAFVTLGPRLNKDKLV
jgi:hypothetical protein